MFGVGWTEMLLIGIVALVVIGPKDLPMVMNRLGKAVASVRRMGTEFQRELNKTTGLDQITDLRRSITEPLKQTAAEITREFNRPLPTGAVEPTGIVKPEDPAVEDVTSAIMDQLGISPAPETPLDSPAALFDHKHLESPAPIEAIAPVTPAPAPAPAPAAAAATPQAAAPTATPAPTAGSATSAAPASTPAPAAAPLTAAAPATATPPAASAAPQPAAPAAKPRKPRAKPAETASAPLLDAAAPVAAADAAAKAPRKRRSPTPKSPTPPTET